MKLTWIIALMFALVQTSAPSAEESVAYIKRLLAGFGVRGKMRLHSTGTIESSTSRTRQVVIMDSRGSQYTAYLTPTGRVRFLLRGSQNSIVAGWKENELVDAGVERTVRAWLKATGTPEPTRLASLTQDEKGIGRAYFPILRNGYPFVSHQRYGFDFRFAVKGREFIELRALEDPPPVDPTPPKLDRSEALAAVKRVYDTEITPQAINQFHWRRVWYTLNGEPELGYFQQPGRSQASLVWVIRFISYRDVGYAIQGGDNAMLIDAVSGARIPTTVVP